MNFSSYSSIGQLRNAVHTLKLRDKYVGRDEDNNPIYNEDAPLSTVEFEGTVKLHGTNAGIGFSNYNGDEMWFQSRTSVITPLKDNAGFSTFYSSHERIDYLKKLNQGIRGLYKIEDDVTLIIYGEWCGGNIQKSVALNQLGKKFVIFGLKTITDGDEDNNINLELRDDLFPMLEENYGITQDHEIYNIKDFRQFKVSIDLANPKLAADLIEKYTDEVERECPFCKEFGVSGLGEGIVWITKLDDGTQLKFKSKGEKHAVVAPKVKTPVDIEKVESIKEFVEYAVTKARLAQGIENITPISDGVISVKDTGNYIKWVIADVAKEELDTLVENGLTIKEASGEISRVAREYLFTFLDGVAFGRKS